MNSSSNDRTKHTHKKHVSDGVHRRRLVLQLDNHFGQRSKFMAHVRAMLCFVVVCERYGQTRVTKKQRDKDNIAGSQPAAARARAIAK